MLSSMTAYGQTRLSDDEGEFVCEIRSVNHRYLDVGARLDETLRTLEQPIRERIASRLQRGKVDVSLRFKPSIKVRSRFQIDHQLLDALLASLGDVSERCNDNHAPIDTVALMQWPGVVSTEITLSGRALEQAMQAFEQALNDHLETRLREGAQILVAITERGRQLQHIVSTLRRHRPSVLARQREKLLLKLQQISEDHDQGRLEQELVYAAQKLDIDEELDRLDAHAFELFNVLEREEAVGRRLDFLMQEFNREANTVASKSNDSDTTAASVDMKVLIEQMREQVQNVE